MSDLVTLTIDGVEVSVPKGTLVVDAAKQIGNNIPVFCYHPKMEPVGMCRMCLVEIGMPMRDRATGELVLNEDGTPKINFGRALQTGCTVQVGPGMVVRTQTEPVDEAREAVIEFLLSSHPLDCPICDKGGECPLQNLTMEHGKGETRMDFSFKKKMDKHVPLGELIYLDRERCIQCGRCTRFQDEIVDDPVIGFHNRGRSLEIVTLSDPGFDSYWSGNTTDICPVGALTTADFRFGARPWELTPVASLSPHCPSGSNLTMSTRREAAAGGRTVIKRIMPRQNEAVNEIWISDRDRFVHHFADSPERIPKPLLKRHGEWAEVSWEDALKYVAEKMEEGETAVAGLTGDRLSNEDLFLFQKLFRKGLKSNNIDLANRRIGGGEVVAKFGISSESNLLDLGAGDAIVVVASDLHEEVPVWWLRVKQATERGAKLVVLNARPTRLDKFAAAAIQYRAGEGVATLNQLVSLAKVETDSDEALATAAKTLVEAENLVAFYGSEGLTYSETETVAQLLANLLLVEAGNASHAGKKNSGLIPVWPHNNTQGAWDMGIHPALEPGYKASKSPGMGAADIYKAVESGELKSLFVLGADPVGDGLMAGRGKLDFLVVQELFMTPTAREADIVLPASSWAEREGTFTSAERRVQRYYPAIPTVGETRPDWQILAQIGSYLGLGKPTFAASLVFRDISKAVRAYKGMDYRKLARVEPQWPDVGGDDLYYGGTSYTNRAGLGMQWAAEAESKSQAAYEVDVANADTVEGLAFIRAAALYTSGTLIDQSRILLEPRMAKPTVHLHEADAAAQNVADGEMVIVDWGEFSSPMKVSVNGKAPEGTAVLAGIPYKAGVFSAKISKEEVVAA